MVTTEAKVRENGKANGAREVDTICGFCGVGCGLTLKIENGVIQKVTGEKAKVPSTLFDSYRDVLRPFAQPEPASDRLV